MIGSGKTNFNNYTTNLCKLKEIIDILIVDIESSFSVTIITKGGFAVDDTLQYEQFLRDRITQLRMKQGPSEHRMSLELGKSGSYIRSITSGASLPSVRELFNIMNYLEVTPAAFFATFSQGDTLRDTLCQRVQEMDEAELEKLALFLSWIE